MDKESVQCVVTSPPYYGLRDYENEPSVWGVSEDAYFKGDPECDHDWSIDDELGRTCDACSAWLGNLGLERIHDCLGWATGDKCGSCYVCHVVEVFRGIGRVLRDDGSVWLNVGDSYAGHHGNSKKPDHLAPSNKPGYQENMRSTTVGVGTLKAKDLIGVPWRVALALQSAGWYVRADVIWAKGVSGQGSVIDAVQASLQEADVSSEVGRRVLDALDPYVGPCMPESVTDRPTTSHEHVFLLTKSKRYFYDHWAVRESSQHGDGGRNLRNVWAMPTRPFKDAHFAVFPDTLVGPCLLAGTSAAGACSECGTPFERKVDRQVREDSTDAIVSQDRKGLHSERYSRHRTRIKGGQSLRGCDYRTTGWEPSCSCEDNDEPLPCKVLDPFSGAGTTALVANRIGLEVVGIESNPEYVEMSERRIREDLRDRYATWEEDHPGPEEVEEEPDLGPLFKALEDE